MNSSIWHWRVFLFGLLSWVIPFLVAFLLYDRSGELLIPQPLFKSLMTIIGGGLGAWLLVLVFRRIRPTLVSGVSIGLIWMALNLALDLLVLVPLADMSLGGYFADIGLRYLAIPIIAAAMGVVGHWAQN